MSKSVGGLINLKGTADLAGEDQEKEAAAINKERDNLFEDNEAESRLAGKIRHVWERNRRARLSIDERLLYCLRARKGEYSRTELQSIVSNGGVDPVFIRLTGTKCRAASSWIRDIILPAGDRPWSLQPTTIPTVPPNMVKAAEQAAMSKVQELIHAGVLQNTTSDIMDFVSSVHDKIQKELIKRSKEAADKMSDAISDEMDQGRWDNAIEEFIDDFVTYPSAFLKGPYYRKVKDLTWGKNFEPIVEDKIRLSWKRVSPFDLYPEPNAHNLQDGDLIERLRVTRSQLYDMIGMEGYNEEQIRLSIANHDIGKLKEWIWQDFERNRLESDTYYFTTEPDTIDALHYWGKVEGAILQEWGVEFSNLDPQRSYEIDAILIGSHVIRAVLNEDPLGLRPYHWACWDSIPGSLWGTSLPEQMEDHQSIINACARSLCANMALSSGPQAIVMVDQIPQGEDITNIFPFKIWQAKSNPVGGTSTPVSFFQPQSNAEELMQVMAAFEQKADDVTNVPKYSYGDQQTAGAAATASGMSMLMNAAAKGIRRAISSIDANVIRPSVYQAFIYMMLTNDDITIKGDCDVVPRGATALLIKDQSQVRVQAFLAQTSNPIDMQIIGTKGRAALLRENAKLLDLPVDDIIPSDDDIAMAAAQAQAQAQQAQMMQIAAGKKPSGQSQGPMPMQQPQSPQAGLIGNQMQVQQNQLEGQTKFA